MLWHQAKLNIHVGQSKVSVEQQDLASGACERMAQADGKERLSDAALTGCDSNQIAASWPGIGSWREWCDSTHDRASSRE